MYSCAVYAVCHHGNSLPVNRPTIVLAQVASGIHYITL